MDIPWVTKLGTAFWKGREEKTINMNTILNDFLKYESIRGIRDRGLMILKDTIPRLLNYLEEHNLRLNDVGLKEAPNLSFFLL